MILNQVDVRVVPMHQHPVDMQSKLMTTFHSVSLLTEVRATVLNLVRTVDDD